MVSLINKQLLLTAYAYLYITEQQKVQLGSEALQLQVNTKEQEASECSSIQNTSKADYNSFVSPQNTPGLQKKFRGERQNKLAGIKAKDTDEFFLNLREPEKGRFEKAIDNLPGSKALKLPGSGESYATCHEGERRTQRSLFAQLKLAEREKFITEAEVRKGRLTALFAVQPDKDWQEIYFASPGWKDREGSMQNIFLERCIDLENILQRSKMPHKDEIRTEFTHCAYEGFQRICVAKANIQEILMNPDLHEKVREEKVQQLAESLKIQPWTVEQAKLQAADAQKKAEFRQVVEAHGDLGFLRGSLKGPDTEWARKMIEDEAIKCVGKLSDFTGREDPRSQERELKIWLAEAARISGAVSPNEPMKGHRSMSFSQQRDFWKGKLAEAQRAQQEEQKKELKAKREAENKICDCCTMENPPDAKECSVCDNAL